MKIERLLAITIVACAAVGRVHADEWRGMDQTEFFSANRKHMVKLEPQPHPWSKPGHCRATLFREGKEIWSRHLINDHAPVGVFVADSGDYVLTMDEWGQVGKLPVVIYGQRGELIRVHSTDSLGLADDVQHIKMTTSSYWWNEDSVSFFDPDDHKFFIRLYWGKWIILDLRGGDPFEKDQTFFRDDLRQEHQKEWKKLEEYRQQTLAMRAIRMLASDDAHDRRTGAMVCGQEKLTEAIPVLRKLLEDKATFTTNVPKEQTTVYFVRKAAKEALEAMGQDAGRVVTQE